jgi:cytoskeletal protein RodZ
MKYEPTHLPARPFIMAWLIFFIVLVVAAIAVWFLIVGWSRQADPYQSVISSQQNPHWDKSAPQLQTEAAVDLKTLQDQEYARLHTMGWTDPSHAFAKIPIEDAMHLVVAKAAQHQLNSILPPTLPLTPLDLQNQKSRSLTP